MTSAREEAGTVKRDDLAPLLSFSELSIFTNEILRRHERPMINHVELKEEWREVLKGLPSTSG